MVSQTQSMIEEALSALRGTGALIIGDKTAPRYFDLTAKGFVGSMVALLVFTFAQSLLRFALYGPSGRLVFSVLVAAGLYGIVVAATLLFLRLIGRADALVPMLVVQNWVSFFSNIVLSLAVLLNADALVILVGIVVIVISINILRLVSRFTIGQIFGYFGFQILALLAMGLVIMVLAPPGSFDMGQISSQL